MTASILLCTMLVAPAPATGSPATSSPATLTQAQITKLQRIVRKTQDRNTELKAALEDRRQKLMKAYSQFELDEKRISQLHKEIIGQQRELLENYRQLQVELRQVVGEERFLRLKMRIDLFLKGKKKVQVRPSAKQRKPDSEKSQTP